MAYWELEPFGDGIRYMAQIALMIYIANGGQRSKPLKVEDFMPRLVKQHAGEDAGNAMLAWAESMQANAGGGM